MALFTTSERVHLVAPDRTFHAIFLSKEFLSLSQQDRSWRNERCHWEVEPGRDQFRVDQDYVGLNLPLTSTLT